MAGTDATHGQHTPCVVVGAGGMGREALSWLQDAQPGREVVGFLDEGMRVGTTVVGVPVLGALDWLSEHRAASVVGIGSPSARRDVVARLRGLGASLVTVVHPSAAIGPDVVIGPGSIVGPNVTLTRDIDLGEAVIVNYGAQVGHDCSIGAHAFIAPGVNLAGNVTVGEGADVGIGASVIQGVTVGAWSRIGAGAAVVDDLAPHVTAVGVPCRPLPGQDATP